MKEDFNEWIKWLILKVTQFIRKIIIFIVVIYLLIVTIFITFTCCRNKTDNEIIIVDTTYNKTVIDSLNRNINFQENLIYNYKTKLYEELEITNNLDDSLTIIKFKELVAN